MIQPFYASSAINRHGDFRNNEKFLNNIVTEKDTKFIPFYNGKNLFIEINENINSVILNKFQLHDFFPNGIGGTIFLGVANDFNYVGIDLSSPNPKFDCWLKENNIIINDLRKQLLRYRDVFGHEVNSICQLVKAPNALEKSYLEWNQFSNQNIIKEKGCFFFRNFSKF